MLDLRRHRVPLLNPSAVQRGDRRVYLDLRAGRDAKPLACLLGSSETDEHDPNGHGQAFLHRQLRHGHSPGQQYAPEP